MRPELSERILGVAAKLAEGKIRFDEVMEDVRENSSGLEKALDEAEDVIDLLHRSGYPEQADRVKKVREKIRSAKELIDTFHEMYRRGKLRYGPRLPKALWHDQKGIHP